MMDSASTLTVTVLGSGSSGGIPEIDRGWGACDPNEPKNRRLRASILVQSPSTTVLVDTSPDLRDQMLATETRHIDGLVYTHAHADHLHGIDDIRGLNKAMNAPIPAYADQATFDQINTRFGYALKPIPADSSFYFKPTLEMTVIAAGQTFHVGDIAIEAFDQNHGFSRTLGYRFGGFAYSTDLVAMPEAADTVLADLDTWYIGVFTDRPHRTHVHVEAALDWIERVRPRRAILGHLGPDLCYRQLSKTLPEGVEAAFDGLTFQAPARSKRHTGTSTTAA